MEIGSEFWIDQDFLINPFEQFYMSGRSALNAIIRDIKQRQHVSAALLPSYCCDSMIIPFLENDLSVRFYDVSLDENQKITISIPFAQPNVILLCMHYFGAYQENVRLQGSLSDWEAVIKDKTHSFFSGNDSDFVSQYEFVSFRKWFAVSGIAMACSKAGMLSRPEGTNDLFHSIRNEAFSEKSLFVQNGEAGAKPFLKKFAAAEELLDADVSVYSPYYKDYYRLALHLSDADAMIQARRANAALLVNELKNIKELSVAVDFDFQHDCPLFVPVIELSGRRAELRNYLIEQKVYCPIHWPKTSYHKDISEQSQKLYDNELSLVCDQRYGLNDMMRMIQLIKEFYNTK